MISSSLKSGTPATSFELNKDSTPRNMKKSRRAVRKRMKDTNLSVNSLAKDRGGIAKLKNRFLLNKIWDNTGKSQGQNKLCLEEGSKDPLAAIIQAHNTQRVQFDLSRNQVRINSSSGIVSEDPDPSLSSVSIKTFMSRIIFGSTSNAAEADLIYSKVIKPISTNNEQVEKSTKYEIGFLKQKTSKQTFEETEHSAKNILVNIRRAEKYQYKTYDYARAAKYCVEALNDLNLHLYPSDHNLRKRTLQTLNDIHHSQRCMEHSAKIVKIGIGHEGKNEFVKALKMYAIAYRMRRDTLSKYHPSLPVLLNMLGGVQAKRGELHEAMQIFELALYGKLWDNDMLIVGKRVVSPLTKSITLREMGSIHEHLGEDESALSRYQESLECIISTSELQNTNHDSVYTISNIENEVPNAIRLIQASSRPEKDVVKFKEESSKGQVMVDSEEMEVYLDDFNTSNPITLYDFFFKDDVSKNDETLTQGIHVAVTLHHIANIHRNRRDFSAAISAYKAALRGFQSLVGSNHPNVAAVLGNMGNVYKEMNELDKAYYLYQEVLKIESTYLGAGHPETFVSMHNIAMIEKSRKNYKEAIALYNNILSLQKQHPTQSRSSLVATFSCLGDVFEKDGNFDGAINAHKEALWIRSQILDKFHPDIGQNLHRLGVLYAKKGLLDDADSILTQALCIFIFHKIEDKRQMECQRNKADIQCKLDLLSDIGV